MNTNVNIPLKKMTELYCMEVQMRREGEKDRRTEGQRAGEDDRDEGRRTEKMGQRDEERTQRKIYESGKGQMEGRRT